LVGCFIDLAHNKHFTELMKLIILIAANKVLKFVAKFLKVLMNRFVERHW